MITAPRTLGDNQHWRMDGENRDLMVVLQFLDVIDIRGDLVQPDEKFDAVITQSGRELERTRHRLRVDGGAR